MVRELAGRLAALDPDASAAVQVIAYFDRLVEARAGLEAIVRGAAVLAGCPARLVDPGHRVDVRVLGDGRRKDAASPPDPGWLHAPLGLENAVLWLERPGPAGPVHLMILERAAGVARDALERTRGRAASAVDPALVELLLDPAAPEADRLHAARRLRLPGTGVWAVAVAGGPPVIEHPGSRARTPGLGRRAGVGPAGRVADLPASWVAAKTALRLAAEGDEQDPGPRVVRADELGGLLVLAAAVGPDTEPAPDVRALDHAGGAAPWILSTLYAVASEPSLRTAAAALTLHHSTLQDRLTRAEHLLGWNIRQPQGRLRLQLAFALRRLHRHPPD
ncbi:helix-turn-helix domain-containing protein [Acrocarpospora catenulata]|uniref:helix-turn-helix domain-containing protein n=1 Tax=Acrocarpospora catenulata TaxID=2836182 RepID=UPI002023A798|nr:helix-turn-helix domain-containing protein [Acrocarpospora catenulata]